MLDRSGLFRAALSLLRTPMVDGPLTSSDDHDPITFQVREDAGRSCVIIGPADSGKTTLLLALQQACLQDNVDEFNLGFVPDSQSALALTQLASDYLFRGRTAPASREVERYAFRIFVENRRRAEPEYYCSMTVTDGPGGHLFPGEQTAFSADPAQWSDLLEQARRAQSLVLCVDASNPSLEVLYNGLQHFLLSAKGGARRLPHHRLLLLLTKMDRVIDAFARSVRQCSQASASSGSRAAWLLRPFAGGLSPETISRRLSPLGQAHAQLGKVVNLLQAAVATDAAFAVGLCSAFGYPDRDDPRWLPRRPGAPPARSVSERLRRWSPFGVREALLFLAADEVRHPVQRVPPRRLGPDFAMSPITVAAE